MLYFRVKKIYGYELLKKYKGLSIKLNESSELETKLDRFNHWLIFPHKKVKQDEHLIVGRQKELKKYVYDFK